mgnify:CR=1 FL=1
MARGHHGERRLEIDLAAGRGLAAEIAGAVATALSQSLAQLIPSISPIQQSNSTENSSMVAVARHLNPMGSVHGGWFATLLDSALGCAVHTMMPPGRGYTTADLSVKLVKALTPKVQRVRAIGQVVHCGRQLATAEARLVGPDGTLYAHASTACLVFDMPSPTGNKP